MKDCLTNAPILGYPELTQEFILDTDASAFCIGAVLSQVKDNKEQVVAYFSKSLSKPERNYCVTRRELLAVVEGIKHFHHYLYGQHFSVRTDHGALNWLMQFKNPEVQMARWLEVLSVYDFSISHRPGKSHGNADGLSRRPCGECQYCKRKENREVEAEEKEFTHDISVVRSQKQIAPSVTQVIDQYNKISNQLPENNDHSIAEQWQATRKIELKAAQTSDPIISIVYKWKELSTRPSWQ